MTSVDNKPGSLLSTIAGLKFWSVCSLIGGALLLLSCESGPTVVTLTGAKFGTTYNITVVADQPVPGNLAAMIEESLDRVDASMSTYKTSSEISQFNRLSVGESIPLSEDFIHVFNVSKTVWQKSNGALEPTVGPLVNLWGFGPDATEDVIPEVSQIALARTQLGFDRIKVSQFNSGPIISKTGPVELDFSAVAKGYAVDVIAELLEMNALPDYLVEIGGETRVSGYNPEGRPWRLGIQVPQLISEVEQVIALDAGAVATSGDYRNYFERDGRRYSHTIDPRTGYPIEHSTASVTVVADTCAEADAWATALMVLGYQDGITLADQMNLPVFMIVREGTGFKRAYSDSFMPFLDGSDDKSIIEK